MKKISQAVTIKISSIQKTIRGTIRSDNEITNVFHEPMRVFLDSFSRLLYVINLVMIVIVNQQNNIWILNVCVKKRV